MRPRLRLYTRLPLINAPAQDVHIRGSLETHPVYGATHVAHSGTFRAGRMRLGVSLAGNQPLRGLLVQFSRIPVCIRICLAGPEAPLWLKMAFLPSPRHSLRHRRCPSWPPRVPHTCRTATKKYANKLYTESLRDARHALSRRDVSVTESNYSHNACHKFLLREMSPRRSDPWLVAQNPFAVATAADIQGAGCARERG